MIPGMSQYRYTRIAGKPQLLMIPHPDGCISVMSLLTGRGHIGPPMGSANAIAYAQCNQLFLTAGKRNVVGIRWTGGNIALSCAGLCDIRKLLPIYRCQLYAQNNVRMIFLKRLDQFRRSIQVVQKLPIIIVHMVRNADLTKSKRLGLGSNFLQGKCRVVRRFTVYVPIRMNHKLPHPYGYSAT